MLTLAVAASVTAIEPSFISGQQLAVEGGDPVYVTLTIGAVEATPVEVPYTVGGTALDPDDYSLFPVSPAVIPAGQFSTSLELISVDEGTPEGPETVVIEIDGPLSWWDLAFRFRTLLTLDASGHARGDHVAEVAVDFTALLADLGEAGSFETDSLRVVEVELDEVDFDEVDFDEVDFDEVVDPAVPFQFDPGPAFDATTNAVGTLLVQMTGATDARTYHVYFDTGGTHSAAIVAPQVTFADMAFDEGQESFEITTENATYFYHELGAGFSSLVDTSGNDWIDYHPTGGSSRNFRGIPNLTFSEGYFHPGLVTAQSSSIASGALRASFESHSPDQLWRVRWDVYPSIARLTVEAAAAPYWFLYEGAPGGSLEIGSDFVVRANGTQAIANEKWDHDLVGEEWVYFADPGVGRSLFFAHHGGIPRSIPTGRCRER